MGKQDRLSRDQKRKAKLKKKAERSRKHESLAYHGRKYKTAEYVGVMHSTETGIFQTYVMSGRTLTDDEVEEELERLILRMRQGPLPPLGATGAVEPGGEEPESLVIWNIRRNWQSLEEREGLPKREDLIGVLRTLLSSLATWRSQSMHSQGYLRFLEGFMKQTGVSVVQVRPDDGLVLAPKEEDPLLELGRDWIVGEDEADGADFAKMVEALLRSGEAQQVIETCQQLLGETGNRAFVPLLEAFALRGHRALEEQAGSDEKRGNNSLSGPDRSR